MFSWPLMRNNISRQDLDLLIDHLKQDDPKLTHGPKVAEFENLWSDWLGVKHSVMVNSGASANDLTMLALSTMYPASEILVPPLTWVSDIAAPLHAGLNPVFVDINLTNLSFDIDKLKKAISKETKAIFVTHVLGLNAINDDLLDLVEEKKLKLIEDVCESHGATFQGKKLGSIGFASNFSFYYAHHMTTIEGGMICTNDSEFADVVRMMRSHGLVRESNIFKKKEAFSANYSDLNPDFIFAYAAHNMRPTEIQGILGISQLGKLDDNVSRRTENFRLFLSNLDESLYITNLAFEGSSSYAFPIIMKRKDLDIRNKVEMSLKLAGIEFRRGLSGGGNQLRQPYLKDFAKRVTGDFENVDHIHFFSWYVGNYPEVSQGDIMELCRILNNIKD